MSTQHPILNAEKKEKQEPPPVPTTAEQVAKMSKLDKEQILREAVSWYLRQDFRDPVIRFVCEEFIAIIDKESRVAATVTEHVSERATERATERSEHPAAQHEHATEANKPKR
jgi:hypothetical protein